MTHVSKTHGEYDTDDRMYDMATDEFMAKLYAMMEDTGADMGAYENFHDVQTDCTKKLALTVKFDSSKMHTALSLMKPAMKDQSSNFSSSSLQYNPESREEVGAIYRRSASDGYLRTRPRSRS